MKVGKGGHRQTIGDIRGNFPIALKIGDKATNPITGYQNYTITPTVRSIPTSCLFTDSEI